MVSVCAGALLILVPGAVRAQSPAPCAQLVTEVETLSQRAQDIAMRQGPLRAALQSHREQQLQLEQMSDFDLNAAIVDQIDRVRNAEDLERLAADRRRLDGLTQVKTRRVLGETFDRPFARDIRRLEAQLLQSEREAVDASRRELGKRAELTACQARFPTLSIAPAAPSAGSGAPGAAGDALQFTPAGQP
jgi:hypothetical protein